MSIPSLSLKSQVSSLKFKDALSASSKPNFRLQTSNLRRRKSLGLSLVELVMFIVIVGAAVAGIIGVIGVTTRSSADPMIHKQALAIAEAVLEEVQLQPFTYCDPDDPAAATVNLGAGSIAFDAVTTASSSVASYPFTHTPVGTPTTALVGVSIKSSGSPTTVSGVTYGGVAMTLVRSDFVGGTPRGDVWILNNPAAGAQTVIVTLAAAQESAATAVTVTGSATSGQPANHAGATALLSLDPSVTVASAAGRLVIGFLHNKQDNDDAQITAAAGQTQRASVKGPDVNVGKPRQEVTDEAGAASVVTSWTLVVSTAWIAQAVDLAEAGGGCPVLAEAIGPEAGETRYSTTLPFDNVNDYHGFDSNTGALGIRNIDNTLIAGLEGYRVTVSVAGQPLGAIGNDAYGNPQSLLTTVTVTGPGNTTVTLHGYRTRYAPNDLP
jgi:Tfp pilus assembly protein PilV